MTIFNTNQLVSNLKQDGQDFEFYPTTQLMLQKVIDDLKTNVYTNNGVDFLDIGAGDCRLYQMLIKEAKYFDDSKSHLYNCPVSKFNKYKVIEKAITHIQNLSKLPQAQKITLVGTEFLETDLSIIEANICFVNPPYSTYELWITQIISSVRTPIIYAVIPSRWANNEKIQQVLKARNMQAEVIHQDDFLQADRQARAKVDIVRIYHKDIDMADKQSYHEKRFILSSRKGGFDPLDAYFSDFDCKDSQDWNDWKELQQERDNQVAFLKNVFEKDKLNGLVNQYFLERQTLQDDIHAITQVSPRLFAMFKIDTKTIVGKLRQDLSSLKRKYWNIFFDCYEPITKRLTGESRNKLKRSLENRMALDFTYSNCQAVSILAIQQANNFFDEQIKSLFEKHADKDNLACYKSNQRVLTNADYRYRDKKHEFYHKTKLEYRLVVGYWFNSYRPNEFFDEFNYESNYKQIINDYVVIARTLGFDIPSYSIDTKNDIFFGKNLLIKNDKDSQVIFDIKFYKKGTYHIRLNSDFCLRLNVAIGKLFGWLHSADDISEIDEKADKNVWHALSYITPKTLAIAFDDGKMCA